MTPAEILERRKLNIPPDPRILPMLGEITLKPEQCLAELCDNSIDSFLRSQELGEDSLGKFNIDIFLPREPSPLSEITIKDNGTGMEEEELISAVTAGWTGNLDYFGVNLGLFGMGFNIATARLGRCTTIKTSKSAMKVWFVLKIDFDTQQANKTFETELTTIPKDDSELSGTEVTISKLKDDQIKWFSKTSNHLKIRKSLGNFYGSMLRMDSPYPIGINIKVNRKKAVVTEDVMWGSVDNPLAFTDIVEKVGHKISSTVKGWGVFADGSEVTVPYNFEHELDERYFCQSHWRWLSELEGKKCSACENDKHNSEKHTVIKKPIIRGWIGIQKFESRKDFGINLIRKGRVIEYKTKDLFKWSDGELDNLGHPWDSQRGRGRIIGEIHLDDVGVNYTKDRFARESWIWEKMMGKLTHNEPLSNRSNLGFPKERTSPLGKYVEIFDRITPIHSRVKTLLEWLRILGMSRSGNPPYPGKLAKEWANLYRKGEIKYGDDELYLGLVKQSWQNSMDNTDHDDDDDIDVDFEDDPASTPEKGNWEKFIEKDANLPSPISYDTMSKNIESFKLKRLGYDSPLEVNGTVLPWTVILDGDDAKFIYLSKKLANSNGIEFIEPNFTPLDALLSEIAQRFYDSVKEGRNSLSFSQILNGIRNKYAQVVMPNNLRIKVDEIKELCNTAVNEIKDRLRVQNAAFHQNLFDMLSQRDQVALTRKISSRTAPDIKKLITEGKCYDFMDGDMLVTLLEESPESFFDGNCWEETYSGLGTKTIDDDTELFENYRMRLKMRYLGYFVEVVAVDEGDIDKPINDGIALLNVRYYTAARNLLDNLSTIQDD